MGYSARRLAVPGGALAAHIGLRTVMLRSLVFQFLPIVTIFLPKPARPPPLRRLDRARGGASNALTWFPSPLGCLNWGHG